MRGRRKEAVEEAVACGDYATALLVATMCDTETYRRATIAFAQNAFASDSPMTTVAMLFSGALQFPEAGGVPTDLWGASATDLKASWKRHLAGIISNRISGWVSIVLSLGDRLRGFGEIAGAHFCYMVCGCPIASPLKDGTRICLLGANHSLPTEMAIFSPGAIEAFDRTEAYEWAKRQGNKNATLTSFQPFKIIFAVHLVDAGLAIRAKSYVSSIRLHSNIKGDETEENAFATLAGMFEGGSAQLNALKNLERELGVTSDIPFSQALRNGHNATVTKGDDALPHSGMTMSPVVAPTKSDALEAVRSRSPSEFDATFISARSNLMEVTGYTVDTPEKSAMSSKSPPASNSSGRGTSSKSPTIAKVDVSQQAKGDLGNKPKASPLDGGAHLNSESKKQDRPVAMTTPKTTTLEKPKAAPSTAPSVLIGSKPAKQNRTLAPSSSEKSKFFGLTCSYKLTMPHNILCKEGGWSFRKKLVKWINPDATEVSLPENEEKPYYDENRKVWVFPGDNPDDLVKPIAPPPTMAATRPSDPLPVPEAPLDPLAAMMAPPPRVPSSIRRPALGGASRGYSGTIQGVGAPSTAPPQFAVFQPNLSHNAKNELAD